MPITSTAACHGPVPWTSRGGSGAGLGDHLDAAPARLGSQAILRGGVKGMSEQVGGASAGYKLTPKSWPTRAGRLKAAMSRAMPSSSSPKNGMT